MKKFVVSIFMLNFALEIVGGHVPMNGGFSTSPISFCKVEVIKKVETMPKKLTTEEFVRRARLVHGDKYDYSKVEYVNDTTRVCIICPEHGDFQQIANAHLQGCGCPQCKAEKIHLLKNKGTKQFIADARNVHGDEYDYSKVKYLDSKTNVEIICKKHGSFMQTPNSHLRGCGCPKCADERTGDRCRMTVEEFLSRAKEVHGDKYDYSLVTKETFVDSHTDIEIICKKHGVFKQSPNQHLGGSGCYWCGKESMAQKQALTRDEVVNRCSEIFDNKYDYSQFTTYNSRKDIITVVCPQHGGWKVSVGNHLYRQSGCPYCKRSLGEERVAKYLQKHSIDYMEQYRIPNESLFCDNTIMMLDFFLPERNIAIEYNGVQHYKEIPMFNERTLEQQQERDNAVRLYCKEHGIKLIEIPYTEYDNIEKILKKELKGAKI